YSSPATYAWSAGAGAPGAQTVTATDEAGNDGTDSVTLKDDTTAPSGQTITLTGPGAPYYSTASVTFSLADGTDDSGGAGLDTSAAYTASWDTTGVVDGLYDLRVVTTDIAGNSAASSVVANREVDNTAPDTTIDAHPNDPSNATSPIFLFSSSETGSTFECRVDGGSWSSCSSPHTLSPALAEGSHTFDVRAIDPAGNTDASAASYMWTIDTTAPNTSITAQPRDPSNNATPSFSFTSTEGGSTFECRVDGGSWSSCTSPHTVPPALADGSHTF